MRRTGAFVLAALPLLGACAYHNVVHNASKLFAAGEEHRRAGRDSLAVAQYRAVVRKTGEAFRARPGSDWACDALILLGRAHLRLGDLRGARAALERATVVPTGCDGLSDLSVHLAAVDAELGNYGRALERLNRALEAPLTDEARAEAHFLRGRLLMERSLVEHGWWDLDRATDIDSGVRVSAGLTALRWSVTRGDRERGRRAMVRLFRFPEAGVRADSIDALGSEARARWGAADAAALLDGVADAEWDRNARGRLALRRADLLREAGDSAAARRQATEVAAGLGATAAGARLLLARWRLEEARDLADVSGVRAVLLPAESDPRVAALLAAVARLEALAGTGLDADPLGWFAAAEVARDRLGARHVARGLMLAYADAMPDEPWTPKALLAALELTEEVGDRAWLRGRLEAHGDSPYVVAARGGPAAGFEALEEELEVRLEELSRQ